MQTSIDFFKVVVD